MAVVEGRCDDRFGGLAEELSSQLDTGEELGASVAVVHEGQLVVDIWGGWADQARTTPWTEHTITNVWSSSKTVTSLATLMLVDRGLLDPHATVSSYWPEFAAAGKSSVEVRHLLSHTSGLPAWDPPFASGDLFDWDRATSLLAAQAPWWEPGTVAGYHAFTQGFLIGEVIRRATGQTLRDFIAAEIAGPLGADYRLGVEPEDYPRVAPVVAPPPRPIDLDALDRDGVMFKTFTSPAPDASLSWTDAWRSAELGAANGHTNARGLATVQSALSHGGSALGHPLLGSSAVDIAYEEQVAGIDVVLGAPRRFSMGFGLREPAVQPYLPDSRICHWGGWGGSIVVNDADRHLTIAYVMNKMSNAAAPGVIGTERGIAYVTAAFRAVGAEPATR